MSTKQKIKKYRVAFVGNKLNRLDEIFKIVKDGNYKKVYEPFGGSCMISINLKANGFIDSAVANDYDDFIKDLPYRIETSKRITDKVLSLGVTHSDYKQSEENQKKIQNIIKNLNDKDRSIVARFFVFNSKLNSHSDKITLNDFVYFRGNFDYKKYLEYYEKSKLINYDKLDYIDFINKYKNQYNKDTLLIIDPPYLNSTQATYCNETYFGVKETIELFQALKELKIDSIIFNQNKKDIEALLDFSGFKYKTFVKLTTTGKKQTREDVMCLVQYNK